MRSLRLMVFASLLVSLGSVYAVGDALASRKLSGRSLGVEHVASNDGVWSATTQLNAPAILCGGAAPTWSVRDSRRGRMLMMMSDGATTTLNSLDLGTFVWSTLIASGAPPSGWSGQAEIYDSTGDRVLLFGGNTSSGLINKVWALQLSDPPQWVQVAATGTAPTPRQGAGAVFDTWRNRMVVGGGTSSGGGMTDVWAFDFATSHWSQLSPTGTPEQLNGSAVFDERSDRIVQFKYDSSISILSLGDLPAWSSASVNIAPFSWSLSYDRDRNRLVAIEPAQEYGSFGYWSFDLGSFAWTRLTPANGLPSTAKNSNVLVLCFDPSQNRLVEFGEMGSTGLGTCVATNATYLWSFGVPTATLLSLFQAEATAAGIQIRWEFGSLEPDAPFHLERSESANGPWSRIDATTIREGTQFVVTDRAVEAGHTYDYRLIVEDPSAMLVFGPVIARAEALLDEFAFTRVAPSPSSGAVTVEFVVPRPGHVRLTITDIQGRVVERLIDRTLSSGRHQAVWPGQTPSAGSGVFFVRLEADEQRLTKRVVVYH